MNRIITIDQFAFYPLSAVGSITTYTVVFKVSYPSGHRIDVSALITKREAFGLTQPQIVDAAWVKVAPSVAIYEGLIVNSPPISPPVTAVNNTYVPPP